MYIHLHVDSVAMLTKSQHLKLHMTLSHEDFSLLNNIVNLHLISC